MRSCTIQVRGMHCRSCELLIEEELSRVPDIKHVYVNQKKGTATIRYMDSLDIEQAHRAIEKAGYSVGVDEKLWFSRNPRDYKELAMILVTIGGLALIANDLGLFRLTIGSGEYGSLPVVLLVGITAGFSTCMALVGGLVLGISTQFAKSSPMLSSLEKLRPHLFFNLGRVLGFFILGGITGYLGSFFRFSPTILGLLTIAVGLSMVFLGFQLSDISPRLSSMTLTLPKSLSRLLGIHAKKVKAYSDSNTVLLGALSFFLPCGFTQAMQLYAMSTGSPLKGALTMGIFALGTVPGLLGIGGLTAIMKGASSRFYFRIAGVVVLILATVNIANGYNLTGFSGSLPQAVSKIESKAPTPAPTDPSSVQVLKATYSAKDDMTPSSFQVQAGKPVRLEVLAIDNGYGCMGSIAIPSFSKKIEVFKKGQTVVYEFTPKKPGKYQIVCAMGIPHGDLLVK